MQDDERGVERADRARGADGRAEASTFAAKVAAMSETEREAQFPTHSDGQVCR